MESALNFSPTVSGVDRLGGAGGRLGALDDLPGGAILGEDHLGPVVPHLNEFCGIKAAARRVAGGERLCVTLAGGHFRVSGSRSTNQDDQLGREPNVQRNLQSGSNALILLDFRMHKFTAKPLIYHYKH